ncbi:pentatricopeptide repeat-containing protein PNM1 mitochondrial [Tripterygium wilfordii]|uniref:Pentatricopeptide repeat-containing protein PNM1 mitochondrial n=1 Tax=Tripterygium wilfordii TaxID=458696 RepID=A0A7J7C7S6_TRIWF|nr:pentatricopeptide repeat-containing protein PNM1, mitochondrial-like [Tripterygium wilfordii]KAF5730204.1 pentatricopeptide repeat-containing protein PNM1 mitochondrial [Tripterygium wilfordii]
MPSLQLGRVLRYCLLSSSSSSSWLIRPNTFSSRLATTYFPKFQFLSRPFSSQEPQSQDPDPVALSISTELLQSSNTDTLSVSERLHLNFSHITPTSSLILQTLNLSPDAGRTVLGFHHWLVSSADFKHTDDTLSFFIDYFGRRKDFKATDEILAAGKGVAGDRTLESVIDRLVRAGRPTQVVGFFERMEREYGFKRDKNSLKMVVEKLCENGYANYAEKMVKNLANEIFPDEVICDLLIKGCCVDGKLEEAKRLAGEMYRGGFEIGIMSYNAILDCVCKLCRQKDPFRLQSEAEKVLVDMETDGVPRNVETFNVLISNLCKLRKTEDAMNLFYRMGEWGCHPNETTFLVLIRSLYQAARVAEGDEMIDRMKSAGYGEKLDKKAYYGFLKILCGIERLEHAMTVFKKMKDDGCEAGIKTYDLLMGKWCSLKRIDKANALFNEALKNGVPVTPKEYRVDPRFLKKPKADEKKEKKRETLPEKMARKRRRLKQIRLSFVKKPQKRRAI